MTTKPKIDEALFALAARVAALTLGRTSAQDDEQPPTRYADLLRGTVVTAYMELLDARVQILEELAQQQE